MCPGCPMPIALRAILQAAGQDPVITVHATGCSEICMGAFPHSAFRQPWIHSLFENAPSVACGLESLKQAWQRKGKLNERQKQLQFLAIGGDGAMSDIGFQWLSGAAERGHKVVLVCFDNEGFMNTGHQRSSSTPAWAQTATTPGGKAQSRKNLTEILAAHKIPFAAQATAGNIFDLQAKAKKAFAAPGPAFLNVLCSCPTGWKFKAESSLEILQMAVETNFWPLFEVENGRRWRLNFRPKDRQPVGNFLKMQGRFAAVLKDPKLLQAAQEQVDENFAHLEQMEKVSG